MYGQIISHKVAKTIQEGKRQSLIIEKYKLKLKCGTTSHLLGLATIKKKEEKQTNK